ncbi:MAG: penicillin acylase family protein, partial [Gammaproteobacteria bacterium]
MQAFGNGRTADLATNRCGTFSRSRSLALARAAGAAILAVALAGCAAPRSTPGPGSAASHGTVEVVRDGYGVPHVYADEVRGLYYGMGYALAEDRLFQMEMARRTFTGSVAEVLGAGPEDRWVQFDRSVRSNYDPRSIAAQLAALPPADMDVFEGYAAGFNARIAEVLADKANLLPREFIAKGFEPVPWKPF